MVLLRHSSRRLIQLLPGVMIAGALALLAFAMQQFTSAAVSDLLLALLAGLCLRAALGERLAAARWQSGLVFLKTTVLRLGIVLFGFRLSWSQLSELGWQGLLLDLVMLVSTYRVALWLGRRLGVPPAMAALVGAGSSICGAAAVLASASVLRSKEADVAVAIGTVVLFGSIAMLVYPLLYPSWLWLGGDAHSMGVFIGSTVHEIAQVVVAGQAISPQAADAAVLSKLGRVLLLAPFLVCIAGGHRQQEPASATKLPIPWFAFGCLACAAWQSFMPLPEPLLSTVLLIDRACLVLAMAALGLSTCFRQIGQFGRKPLYLGALLAIWLVVVGGILNIFLYC